MSGIKQKATGIRLLMKIQKINITRNVDKCLTLLDRFKQEQNKGNSPLLTQAAKEVDSFYKKTTDHLDGFDSNMQRYLDLSVQTVTEVW